MHTAITIPVNIPPTLPAAKVARIAGSLNVPADLTVSARGKVPCSLARVLCAPVAVCDCGGRHNSIRWSKKIECHVESSVHDRHQQLNHGLGLVEHDCLSSAEHFARCNQWPFIVHFGMVHRSFQCNTNGGCFSTSLLSHRTSVTPHHKNALPCVRSVYAVHF
jgi:hypothetical protein